jgi:hypothetical protein
MTNSAINTTNPIGINSGGTNTASFANTNGTVYYDGTKLATISPGTTGQVLLSNGAGSPPSFQTVAGAGEWILIQTLTATNSSSLDFNAGITGYKTYALLLSNLNTTNNVAVYFQLLMSTDGGSTYLSSYTGGTVAWRDTITASFSSVNSTTILLGPSNATTPVSTTSGYSGTIYIYNPSENSAGIYPTVVGATVFPQKAGAFVTGFTQVYAATVADTLNVNALRLIYTGGNPIISGTASLYALVQ